MHLKFIQNHGLKKTTRLCIIDKETSVLLVSFNFFEFFKTSQVIKNDFPINIVQLREPSPEDVMTCLETEDSYQLLVDIRRMQINDLNRKLF